MSESTGKKRGRKASLVNLEENADKLRRSIEKHEMLAERQRGELAEIEEKIRNADPQDLVAQRNRLLAQLAALQDRIPEDLVDDSDD